VIDDKRKSDLKKDKEKAKVKYKEVYHNIKRVYAFTKEWFWKWGIWRWAGGLVSASLNILIAQQMGKMLDIAVNADWKEVSRFIIILGSFVILRSINGYTNSLTHYRYCIHSGYKLRQAAIGKINSLPISYFESKHTGEVISRVINDTEKMQEFYGDTIAGIWSHTPVNICLGLTLLFGISWKLTLIVIPVIMLTSYLLSRISLPLADTAKAKQECAVKYNSYLRDFLEGNDIYKIFGMQKRHGQLYKDAVKEELDQDKKRRKQRSRMFMVSSINYFLPWVLSYAVGSIFVKSGEITIGELYSFAAILPNVTKVAWQISDTVAAMVETSGIASHLFELLDTPDERKDGSDYSIEQTVNTIEFENVSYAYSNGLSVLDDCSFVVPRNKTTALVGASGGGKTTGFKLLCGYYDDYKGNIKVNGRSIRDWNLSALRRNMAYVSQENYLFDASIMDNIRYGRPDATDEEVVKAAKAAYADDFILQTEKGYDTVLGERGVHLSGGQQQRISIARAILKNAPIILLDEPTAALDTKSEYYVQQALDNLSSMKTVFVIAHRISTIENADNILVLEQGKIIEQGKHKELIAKNGRYIELYSSQIEKGGQNDEEN
jgi:ABC-type multidrug transport system fused ATPase/permease subunit